MYHGINFDFSAIKIKVNKNNLSTKFIENDSISRCLNERYIYDRILSEDLNVFW